MADRRRAQLDLAELLGRRECAARRCRRLPRRVPRSDVRGVRGVVVGGRPQWSGADPARPRRKRRGRAHAASGDSGARAADGNLARRCARQPAGRDGDGAEGARVFAPVTNRGEAIGVLELTLAEPPDEPTLADVALAAHALAYVVIANRRFTDLFEWGQRSVPLSLAAEVQHRLLPDAFTCEAGQFTLAAWLEPAGEVAGDTFDFAMERDTLHISMTDAMGHSIDASILATVLVGGLRNARRAGVGLSEHARLANTGLAEYARRGGFVTGQLARIDLQAET